MFRTCCYIFVFIALLTSNNSSYATDSDAPLITSNQAAVPKKLSSAFERRFQTLLQSANIPGGAYIIVTPNTIAGLGTSGHTSINNNDQVTADTVFRLASVSKTFAAELTALLIQQGKLNWQDPANRYVPQFRIKGNTQSITLEDLLGHSSGIVGHAYDHLIEAGQQVEQILPKFAELTPVCAPSTCYTYQNVLFSLIEPAIQAASQKSYADNLDTHIFKPLGMRTASTGLTALQQSNSYARPHRKQKGKWVEVPVLPTYYRIAPAAGVNASILDMGRWLQAQVGAYPEVISNDVIQNVTTPRLATRGDLRRKHWRDHLTSAHYGLGWRVYQWEGQPLIYHGGWVSGFRADIAFSPQHKVGFAVLLNAEDSTASELSTTFWEMFFAQNNQLKQSNNLSTP